MLTVTCTAHLLGTNIDFERLDWKNCRMILPSSKIKVAVKCDSSEIVYLFDGKKSIHSRRHACNKYL